MSAPAVLVLLALQVKPAEPFLTYSLGSTDSQVKQAKTRRTASQVMPALLAKLESLWKEI